MASSLPTPSRPWGLLAGLALPPAVLAVVLLGQAHPDEVFQFTEPAMRLAFGTGVTTWEWVDGLRNYVVVGALAGLLKACAAVGLDSVLMRRLVLTVPLALLHGWTLASAWTYLRRRGSSLWPLVLFSTWGVFWAVGARPLSESLSVPFLVAMWCELDPLAEERPRRATWSGVWWGAAVVMRYGSLALLPALPLLRRFGVKGVVLFLAGAALPLLALGAVDAATWGSPWASLITYVGFNAGAQAAERFGASPWTAYGLWGVSKLPLWSVVAVALWLRVRRTRVSQEAWLLTVPGLYLVALLLTPHKEARFLMPALALLCLWTAGVWARWLEDARPPRWLAAGALVAFLGSNAATYFLYPKEGLTPRQVVLCHASRLTAPGASKVLIVDLSTWSTCGSFVMGTTPWRAISPEEDAAEALADPSFDVVIFNGDRRLPADFDQHATRVFDAFGVVAFRRAR